MLDGDGEEDDDQVGGGVQGNGERAENHELEEDVAAAGGDELRDEGEEEEGGFGIQDFGEDALAESVLRRGGGNTGEFDVAAADHADAEPNEVGGAGVFDSVESDGGGGEDRGDAKSGGENVKEAADESADGRLEAFASAAGEAARQDVEDAGAGSYGEKERGREED